MGKEEEEPVLKKGYTEAKNYHVGNIDTNYLKKMLTSSGVDKQTKEAIKHFFKQTR